MHALCHKHEIAISTTAALPLIRFERVDHLLDPRIPVRVREVRRVTNRDRDLRAASVAEKLLFVRVEELLEDVTVEYQMRWIQAFA
jgi:hypothetical protein